MNCIEKQKQVQTRSCDGEAIYAGEDELSNRFNNYRPQQ